MQARFHDAWAKLPASLQSALEPIMSANDFPAMLTADQVKAVKTISGLDDDALAFALLPLAAACALTPVSNFKVGAIARGVSGNLYFGANMEFSGAPLQQTIHAEQCAVTHAWLRNEASLVSITVNYTPCGHCRQFMNELNSGTGLHIHLPNRPASTLGQYLPDSFGPKDLNITTLLMDPVDHGYKITETDVLTQAALDGANHSHAPYSNSHSGVALEAADSTIYTGRYAENAAFNPSLPPLQAALIMANMSDKNCNSIRRAVLVEGNKPVLTQWNATQATLAALGCSDVKRVTF
ncbi:cytidine deaminase [Yersinia enterocolitica]|uniref:Cytidine deaminase n=1 Tax=Yersinia enterocolitica serotype O:8 / biotype 1B (strain NCTC 13174 / 8081) TaxID=393305 RepID=A1JTY3_YERE8|nr:cytidine deaminase [Yersinia enterocolitica]AJJ22574.1 cytidine deaminase [Yersinia enterocolitica]CAL12825.1 cytidine deaminase [Yersinia enterocolitica subsp. enterocolitica 8081]CNG25968.1 cytidine deaminase [Yersinia enterocolitica]CRY18521.1 cytidine deaminase [Yersinia enterocolitica]HDL8280722.1 cytidine deaminase [Yersinia enterocolitica]